jgi:hypothetical protein
MRSLHIWILGANCGVLRDVSPNIRFSRVPRIDFVIPVLFTTPRKMRVVTRALRGSACTDEPSMTKERVKDGKLAATRAVTSPLI